MKGKILLVVGLGIGYVLGTRAGRERYEELKSTVTKFWNDPRVQKQVSFAEDFVSEKVPGVAEFFAAGDAAPASKPAATGRPATSKPTASKPAAAKPAAAKPAAKPSTTK